MTRSALTIGSWVATPDGAGEIVGYEPNQDRPYYVQLSGGAECSADLLLDYTEADLTPIERPRLFVPRNARTRQD